jgi:hypothetical protein
MPATIIVIHLINVFLLSLTPRGGHYAPAETERIEQANRNFLGGPPKFLSRSKEKMPWQLQRT